MMWKMPGTKNEVLALQNLSHPYGTPCSCYLLQQQYFCKNCNALISGVFLERILNPGNKKVQKGVYYTIIVIYFCSSSSYLIYIFIYLFILLKQLNLFCSTHSGPECFKNSSPKKKTREMK